LSSLRDFVARGYRRFPGLTSGACACHRFAIHKKTQLQNSRIGLACHCDCVAPAPPVCDFVENPASIYPPRTQRHTCLSVPRCSASRVLLCSLARHHPQANPPKTNTHSLQSRSQIQTIHLTTTRPRFPHLRTILWRPQRVNQQAQMRVTRAGIVIQPNLRWNNSENPALFVDNRRTQRIAFELVPSVPDFPPVFTPAG